MQNKIEVKIADDVLKGVYANNMSVMHTAEEFVIDFMNILPPNGVVTSRVIISPGHLKRIIAALQDNISKYEKSFGTVKEVAQTRPEDAQVSSTDSHKIGFQA